MTLPMRRPADVDFSLMPELYPTSLRPHVRAFGHFVRLVDGIASTPALSSEEKLNALASLDEAIRTGKPPGASESEAQDAIAAVQQSLASTPVSPLHLSHILQAYQRDAAGYRPATWGDVLVYCQFAAAPIGQLLLELSREDVQACKRPADALCAALHILKRLRDCGGSTPHGRHVCIPEQYFNDAMVDPAALAHAVAHGQTRAVIDRVLDGVDQLLREAQALPGRVRGLALRSHIEIVLCRATRLARRFRQSDPLRQRVGLTAWERFTCHWLGRARSLLRPGTPRRTAG